MAFNYAALTMKGPNRKENQDRVVIAGKMLDAECIEGSVKESILAVVCDGVGSGEHGARAASLASGCFADLVDITNPPLSIFTQFDLAKEALNAESDQMASTIAGVYLDDDECIVFNVGDTRVYELSNGMISKLSDDHTRAQAMVDALFARTVEELPDRAQNTLIRWLGSGGSTRPSFSMKRTLGRGVRVIICSDGAYRALGDEGLREAIENETDLLCCCKSVYEKALAADSDDDVSIIVIEQTS